MKTKDTPKYKIPKISKEEEKNISNIAIAIAIIITLLGIGQIIISGIQNNSKNSAKENTNVTNHEENIKDIAKREIIINKIEGVPIYILSQKESIGFLKHEEINIRNENQKEKIIPFFYTKKDAETFVKNFKDKLEDVQVEKNNLGFIYKEFFANKEKNDYILFRKNEKWEFAYFENIPVYFIKNKEIKSPFFLQKDGKIIAIPYFLDKNNPEEAIKNLGNGWEIAEVNLLLTLNHIVSHELGSAVTIVPINEEK